MCSCASGVHSVLGVLGGRWSQVVSGVVTLGCLSPRPRVHAPVLPVRLCVRGCARVCRRVYACVRLCACVCVRVCVPVGGVQRGVGVVCWRCGAAGYTSFSFYLSLGGVQRWCAAWWLIPFFSRRCGACLFSFFVSFFVSLFVSLCVSTCVHGGFSTF